jgi:hypothetical protein
VKILVFAPHSAIWVHAFPEALVAEALRQGGHEIVYVTCGRQLRRFCVPMGAHGLEPSSPEARKEPICGECEARAGILREAFGFRGPRLNELLGPAETAAVEQALTKLKRDEIPTLELEGVPVGKLALYQLMLRRKRVDLELSEAEWEDYLVELRNTLYAGHAAIRLLDTERPDRVLVYNGLYSVNRVCCKLAERRGIPHYFMHAGGNLANRLQTLLLGRGDTFTFMPHVVAQWPRFADIPCTPRLLSRVAEHYLELLRGRSVFVYSSGGGGAGNLRQRFGVKEGQRLLLAAMASYDEEVAAEMVGARQHCTPPLFPTQVEWIRALLDLVQGRPDLFLLVRVHPREFPNRRDPTKSQHARLLEEALRDLPSNARVNWPDDGVSMYDLAHEADAVLTSWSSVGKEMCLLGLPVVLYSRELVFYPPDLGYVGTTWSEYLGAIDQALASAWSAERSRAAFRWGALEFIRATIFVGDSYPELEHPVRPLRRKVADRLRQRVDRFFKERADCRRRRARLGAAGQVLSLIELGKDSVLELMEPGTVERATPDEETRALERELARLADALCPTEEARRRSRLYRSMTTFERASSAGGDVHS